MISARKLSNDILLQLGEANKREHSDTELIRCINQILTYMNFALVNIGSSYIKKEALIRARERGVTLPEDFLAFSSWEDEFPEDNNDWKIIGEKITVPHDNTMVYYYRLEPINTLNDEIDLPYLFYLLLLRLCTNYLKGSLKSDEITGEIDNALNELLSNQELPRRPWPWNL